MGLDQYFHTKGHEEHGPLVQLRKINCVQGWMNDRHGTPLENTESIELTHSDIGDLLDDMWNAVYRGGDKMKPLSGFFFGDTDINPQYWFKLGQAFEEIRSMYAELDDDEIVVYHGWW